MKRVAWIASSMVILFGVGLFVLHLKWENNSITVRNIYILDKTVFNSKYLEHKSFFWVLSNLHYQKPDGNPYRYDKDYFGFYPIDPELGTFDFRTIRLVEIDRMADSLDMVYYIDCYGVYSEDWMGSKNSALGQKVYGGLNQNDYLLLKGMKERGKLIVAEHNLFSHLGGGLEKEKLSELFGFTWTGWIGRSFPSFDTTKSNRPPAWVVNIYTTTQHKTWPNSEGGIVFVGDRDRVVLLINGHELEDSKVSIVSPPSTVKHFGVEPKVSFTKWFEVIEAGPSLSTFSNFMLHLTPEGSSLLRNNGIPESFPAALGCSSGYQLYYFAGDFSHTPVYMATSEMVGGDLLNSAISSTLRPLGFEFFNGYYRPFLSKILSSYKAPNSAVDSLPPTN